MNDKIRYVVTALDSNDGSGVPEAIGEFETRHEAEAFALQDMREYCDNYTFVNDSDETVGPRLYDEEKMRIENFDGSASCSWAIVEVA